MRSYFTQLAFMLPSRLLSSVTTGGPCSLAAACGAMWLHVSCPLGLTSVVDLSDKVAFKPDFAHGMVCPSCIGHVSGKQAATVHAVRMFPLRASQPAVCTHTTRSMFAPTCNKLLYETLSRVLLFFSPLRRGAAYRCSAMYLMCESSKI